VQRAWKLNAGQTFLYRVVYPLPHYAVLRANLFAFSAVDRCGVQNDLFAAQRAGMVPLNVLADMVSALAEQEDHYAVWTDLSNNLFDLGQVLRHSGECYARFTAWTCGLYRAALERVGWEAKDAAAASVEHPHLNLLRGKLVGMLTHWGDEQTTREACRRFHAFIAHEERSKALAGTQVAALAASSSSSSSAAVPPPGSVLAADLREGVYHAVVAAGGYLGYEALLARFHAQVASGGAREEQVRCLNALALTPNRALLAQTLEWALDHPEQVRVEDCSEFLCWGAMNPSSGAAQTWWEFARRRWSSIVSTFEGAFCLPRLVSMGAQLVSSESFAGEFAAFMKKNKAPTAERAVKQTVERIQSNAKWLAREEKNITKYCAAAVRQQEHAKAQ
jgi:hypothetical protein